MIKLRVEDIKRMEPYKAPGYRDAVMSAATESGGILTLSQEAYAGISAQFPTLEESREATISEKASNVIRSTVKWVGAGMPITEKSERDERLAICSKCKEWIPTGNIGLGKCRLCGCTKLKPAMQTESCPIGKWGAKKGDLSRYQTFSFKPKTTRNYSRKLSSSGSYSIVCHVDGITGMSQLGLEIAVRLKAKGKLSALYSSGAQNPTGYVPSPVANLIQPHGDNFADLCVTGLQHFNARQSRTFFTMYESTRPPKEWVDLCNGCEAVFVPSDWNRTCFMDSGVTVPIHVVPLGTDCTMFPRQHFRPGPFTFLTGGRILHGLSRKGISDVIHAFKAAFPGDPNVRLICKLTVGDPTPDTGDDRITIIHELLTPAQMLDLYASCHVFVTATRCEGWGLMPHQAMTVGRPVIAPIYGGLTEFLDGDVAFPVEFNIENADTAYKGHGQWAVPVMDSLIHQMRECYHNPSCVLEKAERAHERAIHYSWDLTVNTIDPLLATYCGPKKKPKHHSREKTFYHAGDIGDALFGLSVMKELGGGRLILGQKVDLPEGLKPRDGITSQSFDFVYPLIAEQDYVRGVEYSPHEVPVVDYDLNRFRLYWKAVWDSHLRRIAKAQGRHSPATLQMMHRACVGLWNTDETEPWLSCTPKTIDGKRVIIHRSFRARNDLFQWPDALDAYGDSILFIGLPDEHADFVQRFGDVDFYRVKDALEMAEIIAGADLVIGNTTCAYTIAEGLKQNTIQETRIDHPSDNIFIRPNAYYCFDGKVTFPPLDSLVDFYNENKHHTALYWWKQGMKF